MSVRRARLRDVSVCPHRGSPGKGRVRGVSALNRPVSREPTAGREDSHRLGLRYLREHAMRLALVGMLAIIALPPTLVVPLSGAEIIATVALTLLAGVLVASICHERLRR